MTINPKLLAAAKKVTAHRAKTVINHIIEHGFISTEDLKETYGYNHPPRAAGDVRDQGIPLETFKVTGKDGRKIAAYRFGNIENIDEGKLGGRKVLPKQLKDKLIELNGMVCAVTCETYDKNYLQIDHRVPYRVSGDTNEEHNPKDFMLLCGSAQRQKSWACEHCSNFNEIKSLDVCEKCYWAQPDNFEHVAMKQVKQVSIVFTSEHLETYQKISIEATKTNTSIQDVILRKLK